MLRLPNKESEEDHDFGGKGGYLGMTLVQFFEVTFMFGELSQCSLLVVWDMCVSMFICTVGIKYCRQKCCVGFPREETPSVNVII